MNEMHECSCSVYEWQADKLIDMFSDPTTWTCQGACDIIRSCCCGTVWDCVVGVLVLNTFRHALLRTVCMFHEKAKPGSIVLQVAGGVGRLGWGGRLGWAGVGLGKRLGGWAVVPV